MAASLPNHITCCIAGGGPAGVMLGFLLARGGVEVLVLEKHQDFLRDFRGDTIHPSTLQVMVQERSPFAVWQSKGRTYVVDAEGVVLAPALRDAYTDLPLVVGEGAAKNAAALVAQLAAHDDLNKQILAAIRVGDRRWTLKLLSGAEVMLPDDNVPEALASLVKLDGERRVLERDIATVDLRLLDRITVRLRAAEATRLQDGTQDDIPTASTKSTPAKGKT